MNKAIIASFLSLILSFHSTFAQQIPPPQAVLGFPLGSQFSRHHQIVDYVEQLAEASNLVEMKQYGTTPEGRPLIAAIITSEANHKRLESIRQQNLALANMGESESTKATAIVWMSYNVHGDEAVCSEAAMGFMHQLLTKPSYTRWLDSLVVILDPCLNPDGRDRYVNWYRNASSNIPNVHANSWEHHQPWPGGRLNHYCFDLNRDWAWQSQSESQQRLAFYQQWMPQVHVDFHEMGYNSPYFFAPAAEPYHPQITSWQREFQQLMGANHAKYFDQNNWLYYTGEVFDLYYPSYGDTWPIFNGAQGFTYEQGGSGRAGRAVARSKGDTLTVQDRLQHHLTTSISTVELSFQHRDKLLEAFQDYFSGEVSGKYKTYIVKKANASPRLSAFTKLLYRQKITYTTAAESIKKSFTGFSYLANASETSFSLEKGDILISTNQPQGHLVQVLFEPHTTLSDSLTYDLTAWALPYVFQIEAYAAEQAISLPNAETNQPPFQENKFPENTPYAILCRWKD